MLAFMPNGRLKAVLLANGVHFPKAHDIEFLIDLVRQTRSELPTFSEAAAVLNQYIARLGTRVNFETRSMLTKPKPQWFMLQES